MKQTFTQRVNTFAKNEVVNGLRNLLPQQINMLKEFVTSVNAQTRNEEKVKKEYLELLNEFTDTRNSN